MPIKAVLFDLDNTLIDFMKLKRMCVENAVDAMIDSGLEMKKEEAIKTLFNIYSDQGIEYQEVFQEFSRRVLGREDYRIMAAGINSYRKTKISYLKPYPHVVSTLTELAKKGIKLAIVTDAEKMQAWLRISALEIGHLLDVVITSSDTGKKKPNLEPFKKALEELDMKAEECLFIGDHLERDIEGAKKIGMKTCFARYGYNGRSIKSNADHEIDDINELFDIVR
ncbi:MAG: TIGR02253 family HAD-type hydrolase [Candidatus Altiarchaeota archaeon]|nr:TIGR02253 family HAD-type hydrolase [Candidatus Altiarchaeota archaeon]